jgi:hypothetical protein
MPHVLHIYQFLTGIFLFGKIFRITIQRNVHEHKVINLEADCNLINSYSYFAKQFVYITRKHVLDFLHVGLCLNTALLRLTKVDIVKCLIYL